MEQDNLIHTVLEKLGMALYLHKKLAEDAKAAKEAVEYFKTVGVLKNDVQSH